ncbi:hypothetical protein OH77DRAFT_484269 [Trametes cingulata]|nr:hypothetical protein OH77DRAFT_484269 [Trametes cingulata]
MSTLVHPVHLCIQRRLWSIDAGNLAPQTKLASSSPLTTRSPTVSDIHGNALTRVGVEQKRRQRNRRSGARSDFVQSCAPISPPSRIQISRLVPAFSEFAPALLTRPAFPRTFQSGSRPRPRAGACPCPLLGRGAASKSIAFGVLLVALAIHGPQRLIPIHRAALNGLSIVVPGAASSVLLPVRQSKLPREKRDSPSPRTFDLPLAPRDAVCSCARRTLRYGNRRLGALRRPLLSLWNPQSIYSVLIF